MSAWLQNYDPLNSAAISTLVAALPVVALLGLIAWGRMPIHKAAVAALLLALGVAVWVYEMPGKAASMAAVNGACYGLLLGRRGIVDVHNVPPDSRILWMCSPQPCRGI